ncbi:DUF998 domain-containing protein [Pseudonocardia alaniniphila]|uniref:DUF998 domain-containing protein n=1 Tax=Pseudonocardia alaniniphila TaxID=75291 RepID=A0ABS9T6Y9_9PSEU|nr:DUF998 domain-containing protein [Pseudonocardia alaniniphila]MCH6164296.1 DUF998 domain-containing protein [Pseudonocardia alaniniphila]
MDPSWFTPNRNAVLSYMSLRRSVGAIGVALPPVLAIGAAVLFDVGLLSSVSAYYYTGMRGVLVGSLCAIGVFLLSYRFGKADDLLGDIAGIAAIGLALFPTAPEGGGTGRVQIAGVVHLVFAAVFFIALALFSLFLFTRTDGDMTPRKIVRNVVYRVCGWVIVACLVLAVVTDLFVGDAVKAEYRPLFWLETVAVLAFGVSWLVKGEALLGDRPTEDGRGRREAAQVHEGPA